MNEHKSNNPNSIPFYTVAQLSQRWLSSAKKIRREIKSGKLIAHKFNGQISVSDTDRATYERINRRGG